MHSVIGHTNIVYWIAKSKDETTIVYGCVEVGDQLNTGQEILLTFNDEESWEQELNYLGITEIEK